MNLDPRIIEGKKPLDCFDTEIAKQFIGKEGYFTDCLEFFTNIRLDEKCMLTAIDEKAQSCFKDVDGVRWDWFLPAEWVKEPEKKYRAYTLKEFIDDVNLGEPWIKMRPVGTKKECKFLYTGYQETEAGEYICLGCFQFDFVSLFQNYEICINGEWQPFGVLDEEDE